MPGSPRGRAIETFQTGIPDLKLIRYENRLNLYLRIYDRESRKNIYRSLPTTDTTTALKIFHETYRDYLTNPVQKKEEKTTMVDCVDMWCRHIESRCKKKEIGEKTKVSKIHTITSGILPYLQQHKLLRVKEMNPRVHFKKYVEWRIEQGYKHSTIGIEIKHLNEWLKFLHTKGIIKDPTSDISLPRRTYKAQSEEESVEAFTDEQ